MLDHLSLGVPDLARSAAFYDEVLSPLGYVRLFSTERGVGYGRPGDRDEQLALLALGDKTHSLAAGFHLALLASSREAVVGFHAAAIRAGGADDGGPGLRPQYGPGYYAAFVRDPDGYAIEPCAMNAEPCG